MPGSEGCIDILVSDAAGHAGISRGREPARERRRPDAAATLLSIRPKYVELISDSVKRVEFRRCPFARYVAHVVIYATSPVMKLVGFCEAEKLVEDTPAALWARYGPVAGLSREALFRYLNGVDRGLAIQLGPFRPFAYGLALPALGIERPPQSFRYLPKEVLADLVGRVVSLP